jgi:hypothetical protein
METLAFPPGGNHTLLGTVHKANGHLTLQPIGGS